MIKIYSKRCEHILRILREIPKNRTKGLFLARDISEKAGVSEDSARKGLQMLVKENVLKAVSGPNGGYEFAVDPRKISVFEIIEIIDGKNAYTGCIMGFPLCDHKNPCAMHNDWLALRNELSSRFSKKSLYSLMSNEIRGKAT